MRSYQADEFSRLDVFVKKITGLLAIGAHGNAFTVHVKIPFRENIALLNKQDAGFHVGELVRLEAERVYGRCVSNCCWFRLRFGFGFGICGQSAYTCDM